MSKRIMGLLTCALVLLAAAFAVVFPRLGAQERPIPATAAQPDTLPAATADALSTFRTERSSLREQALAQMREVAEDEQASSQVRDEARRRILSLTEHMEQEVTLEGVLRARGYGDAVATVHADSVNVLVRTEALTRAESAAILELALRETGQLSGNIKIIPVA